MPLRPRPAKTRAPRRRGTSPFPPAGRLAARGNEACVAGEQVIAGADASATPVEARAEDRFDIGRFAFVHLQSEGPGLRRSWLGVVRDVSTSGLSVYAMCHDAPEIGMELSLDRHFFYLVRWRQPLDGGFVLGLQLLRSEADIFSVLPLEP